MKTCPHCGSPLRATVCSSCGRSDIGSAYVSPMVDLGHEQPGGTHITGKIGMMLGLVANLIVIVGTFLALPAIVAEAQGGGGEIDEATAIGFFVGMLAVGGLALVGLVLSIIGAVTGRKKLLPILGAVVCVLPPVTYILACAGLGVYLAATGQL